MAVQEPPEHPERHWWVWLLLLAIGVVVALGLLYWWQQQEDDEEEAGPRAVPSVIGLTEQEARDVLAREGFEAEVEEEESDEPDNTVVAQEPEPGTLLEEGGTVTLTVSRGPPETETETETVVETETAEEETSEVPDVVGEDHIDAGDAVADAGFLPETYPVESPEEAGTVVAQNPDAGTELREGQRVRLNVSLGEGERQEAEIPDVTGPDAQDGLETCRDAGFTCRIVERDAPSQEEVGEVIDQQPAAGSTARQLTQITLYVGR
jgi:eukaryotic-like serine/threonine-protein kinase